MSSSEGSILGPNYIITKESKSCVCCYYVSCAMCNGVIPQPKIVATLYNAQLEQTYKSPAIKWLIVCNN